MWVPAPGEVFDLGSVRLLIEAAVRLDRVTQGEVVGANEVGITWTYLHSQPIVSGPRVGQDGVTFPMCRQPRSSTARSLSQELAWLGC